MSSYHTSFEYNDKNSLKDMSLIVVSFEPDEGFTDSFLAIDNISDDYYDGTKKYNYGSKYSNAAEIQITVIKRDGSDMKLNDFRACAKWLTGTRTDSWLDLYPGDDIAYSFLGKFTNLEQYKLDARTVGLRLTFSSISPWAYSAPQVYHFTIEQTITVTGDGVLVKSNPGTTYIGVTDSMLQIDDGNNDISFSYDNETLSINDFNNEIVSFSYDNGTLQINNLIEYDCFGYDDGVLCVGKIDSGSYFYVDSDGTAYISEDSYVTEIDNQSDDLYTYIYLDIVYKNKNGNTFRITNATIGEETNVLNLTPNEIVSISAKQFITSSIVNKIFGDDFNFVWPRLAPGTNQFVIECGGNGTMTFTYRYPMKVGDCTMDISTYGSGIDCGNCDGPASYDTVRWKDIVDTPTTIGGYGITDAYTDKEVDAIIDNIEISGGDGTGSVSINEEKLNQMLSEILQ